MFRFIFAVLVTPEDIGLGADVNPKALVRAVQFTKFMSFAAQGQMFTEEKKLIFNTIIEKNAQQSYEFLEKLSAPIEPPAQSTVSSLCEDARVVANFAVSMEERLVECYNPDPNNSGYSKDKILKLQ